VPWSTNAGVSNGARRWKTFLNAGWDKVDGRQRKGGLSFLTRRKLDALLRKVRQRRQSRRASSTSASS